MGPVLLDGPAGRVLAFAFASLTLIVTVGGLLYLPEIAVMLRRLANRVRRPPVLPTNPPIEQVARTARRLRAKMRALDPDTPMARRLGLSLAYDDVLAAACHALDVPDTLSELRPGTDRDAERLRVEHALEAAGMPLRA
ncbi:MAG: hypothetical protein WCG47_24000 [Dermatophilaceae bacterium]